MGNISAEQQQRIGELSKEIRQNEKEIYLDFNNPVHDEYLCLQMGGREHFEGEFPDLYGKYLQTKEIQSQHPEMVTIDEKDAFKDAAQIIYAYQDENHKINFKGITALKHSVEYICERIHIYSEKTNELIAETGRVTSNTHFTKYEFEWENEEEKYQTGKIIYDYFSMWYSKADNFLRAVIYSSEEEIAGENAGCVDAIRMDNPSHRRTAENEKIGVCYNRIPACERNVDYIYREAFDSQTQKQQLLLEVDGNVVLNSAYKEFQWIDMNGFVLKLYCTSGVATYSTEGRVEAIRNCFQKTGEGFSFHLDKDWKGVIPAARLPIVEDVELLMRVPFTTDKAKGSILIDSTLSSEKVGRNKISMSKLQLLWGCVGEDTKVRMADGMERPISQIQPGDWVMTRDDRPAIVMDILRGREEKLWHIETTMGDVLNCTKDHPMLTDSGLKLAGELCGEDKLVREFGETVDISAMYQVPGGIVYSLLLEGRDGQWLVTNGLVSGDFMLQNHGMRAQGAKDRPCEMTEEIRKLIAFFEGKDR